MEMEEIETNNFTCDQPHLAIINLFKIAGLSFSSIQVKFQ